MCLSDSVRKEIRASKAMQLVPISFEHGDGKKEKVKYGSDVRNSETEMHES